MRRSLSLLAIGCVSMSIVTIGFASEVRAAPEIRMHQANRVPSCVTPPRLMQFVMERNPRLEPKFRNIAAFYEKHGRAQNVRWDYAFFQMVVETNYLQFKNATGKGDVSPQQNNFAGIGTTGGGVPGDTFPDVSTGVLGQMQHLIAYSGERVENPVGRRTRERQDDIIDRSKALKRPVTFRDLAKRWAVDARYATTIEAVASRYRATYCTGVEPDKPDEKPLERSVIARADVQAKSDNRHRAKGDNITLERSSNRSPVASGFGGATEAASGDSVRRSGVGLAPGAAPSTRSGQGLAGCRVFTASYGGGKAILVRAMSGIELHYTAVQVLEGHEAKLAQHFLASHARGGDLLGEFATRDAALGHAFSLCPRND